MSRAKRKPNVIYPDDLTYPNNVVGTGNITGGYYKQLLTRYLKSRISFENLPSSWDSDYIRAYLFSFGYLGMVVKNGNSYCVKCGYTGLNINEKPTKIIISNIVLGSFESKIGVDGELLYFDYNGVNFTNLDYMLTFYAEKLASCDASINTSLINSRVAQIFTGENDAEIKTLKKAYDEITLGTPAIFIKKGNSDITTNTFTPINVKQTYICNDIQITKQSIFNEFCTEIGIENANTDKRERLNTEEVNANNGATKTLFNMYIETINQCLSRFNKIAKTNVKCSVNDEKEDNTNVQKD